MTDDPGVLSNLPRKRPGRRSDKRAAAGASEPAAARKTPARSAAPRKSAATAKRAPSRPRPRAQPGPEPTGDPISGAIRTAGQLAEASVKTAVKITGGVIKRLPRL